MTQKTINIFQNELYTKGPKQNYIFNKTDVYQIDDIWSLNVLDFQDCDPEHK